MLYVRRTLLILWSVILDCKGRDSWVGIATCYGLDGPGIESRWEARFSASFQTDPVAHPASCTMGTGSFLGSKAAGAWCWPPTRHLSAEVEGGVELYLYSPSGPSWPVIGRTLPLSLPLPLLYIATCFDSYGIIVRKFIQENLKDMKNWCALLEYCNIAPHRFE